MKIEELSVCDEIRVLCESGVRNGARRFHDRLDEQLPGTDTRKPCTGQNHEVPSVVPTVPNEDLNTSHLITPVVAHVTDVLTVERLVHGFSPFLDFLFLTLVIVQPCVKGLGQN